MNEDELFRKSQIHEKELFCNLENRELEKLEKLLQGALY
jgi:hypothetical protein